MKSVVNAAPIPADPVTSVTDRTVAVVLNPGAGSGRAEKVSEQIHEAFRQRGCSVRIEVPPERSDVGRMVKELVKWQPGVIVAAGGTARSAP